VDHDVDVLVAGGGPIGLAVAIGARLAGLSAVVVDPRPGPIDKACGEGLMPGAVVALDRLGVHPTGHPLAGIAYVDGSRRAEHRFRRGTGLGVRRTVLHAALSRRAAELGVEVLRDRVRDLAQDPDGVSAAGLRASWLFGCDGLHSTVRRLLGAERSSRARRSARPASGPVAEARRAGGNRRRFGLRQHFRLAPWGDLVEVHWGRQAEAYVTPVAPDLVGIALLGPPGLGLADQLADLPELARRLRGATPDAPVRGAGPLRQRTSRRVSGRVLLVGDASGYVDALTGEGIRLGLAQAEAALACVLAGRPGAYERAWATATRDFRVLTGALVAAATSPVRPLIVPAAAALPRLYGGVVERLAR
jgi:2-polyprenyl-6-methoxyphenol hydroxylase-like FAD-dependent oxidoreductase